MSNPWCLIKLIFFVDSIGVIKILDKTFTIYKGPQWVVSDRRQGLFLNSTGDRDISDRGH